VTIIIQRQQVRFTAQKAVEKMRLQVFNQAGETVFDGGSDTGAEISWPLRNGDGQSLKSGLYAYTLSIKDFGADEARVRRGHFIVDRAADRDAGSDRLWVTSPDASVGAELTVARGENISVAGITSASDRSAARQDAGLNRSGGREVETEAQRSVEKSKTPLAAAAAGTVGKIAKFTSTTDVGDSVITELNGNIGVGTATPSHQLSLGIGPRWTSNSWGGSLALENGSAIGWKANTAGNRFGIGHTNGGFYFFRTASDPGTAGAAANYDLAISDTGNVSIGTPNPSSSKLTIEGQDALTIRGFEPVLTFLDANHGNARGSIQQVNGGLNLFTDAYLRGANPYGYLRLDTNGNVGIGTPIPDSRLHVHSGGTFSPLVLSTGSGTEGPAKFRVQADSGLFGQGKSLVIYDDVASQYRMVINGKGNVGIGTPTPVNNLQVEGAGTVEMAINSRNERAVLSLGNTLSAGRYTWTVESGVRGIPALFGIYNRTTNRVGLEIDGDLLVSVRALQITGGADLSEKFDVLEGENSASGGTSEIQPGMVVAIDPINPGKLSLSRRAYDRRVAGIISGGGGVQPGMKMGQEGTLADGKHPVALSGRVYCWVDAAYGAIRPGDLLTTSPTPGHAMKVRSAAKAQGAIIGKAMTGLKSGKGLVLVLVTLQ
jgi:hypothetical protein